MKKDYDITLRGHHLISLYQLHFSEGDEAGLAAMFRFVLAVKYRYDGRQMMFAKNVASINVRRN